MKSPNRPKGPSQAVVGASTEVVNPRTQYASGEKAASALSLFRAANPGSPKRPSSMSASAPSTINSVFGESAYGEGDVHTASPSTAHDFADSLGAVLETGSKVGAALEQLSAACSVFGQALENSSRHKPCGEAAEGISVAGGLHLLISNHLQILGSAFESQLLDPLAKNVAEYRDQLSTREVQFRAQLKEAKHELAQAEARNRAAARNRNRNLAEYRSMLLDMTTQIDDIHRLKFDFLCDLYQQGFTQAEQLKKGLGRTASVELEIFESIARKGWSGGGLGDLVEDDPFDGRSQEHFTVLGGSRLLPDADDGDTTIKNEDIGNDTLEMGAILATLSPDGSPIRTCGSPSPCGSRRSQNVTEHASDKLPNEFTDKDSPNSLVTQ